MKIFFKGGRSGQCFLLQTGAKSTVTDLSEKRSLEFALNGLKKNMLVFGLFSSFGTKKFFENFSP